MLTQKPTFREVRCTLLSVSSRIGRRLNLPPEQLKVRGVPSETGPGNVLTVTLEYEHVTEVFTRFGERGRTAESVAEETARDARDYIAEILTDLKSPIGGYQKATAIFAPCNFLC